MAAHFLTIDHSMSEEHGARYQGTGQLALGGLSLLGWVMGLFLPLRLSVLAMMLAFVSGAIVMNSAIMVLSNRHDGRFFAFVAGGVIYGLLLMPLG